MKTHSFTQKGSWAILAALVLTCTFLSEGRSLAQLPPQLVPEEGNVEVVRALGVGVQIYHSAQSTTDPTKFVWKFFAPQATLFNGGGKVIANHFGGPSWQSNNGSLVVGAVFAKAPAPDPSAIDWLLVNATFNAGNGPFSEVTFIQ